jgi:hypothetical protein
MERGEGKVVRQHLFGDDFLRALFFFPEPSGLHREDAGHDSRFYQRDGHERGGFREDQCDIAQGGEEVAEGSSISLTITFFVSLEDDGKELMTAHVFCPTNHPSSVDPFFPFVRVRARLGCLVVIELHQNAAAYQYLRRQQNALCLSPSRVLTVPHMLQ